MAASFITERTRAIWMSRLASAYRTSLACAIVGGITLFGPLSLQHMLAFPALSYVTVILIVSEATLGDTLRGCWNAVYGSIQGVLPAMLFMLLLGELRFSNATIAFAVALTTFFIALPESTHVVAKRIALAQIVILYSVTSDKGVRIGVLNHSAHVAASTAVGAFATVLALLLPFPRLACREVQQNIKLLNGNFSQRIGLYVKAFCAEDKTTVVASLSEANALRRSGGSRLQTVKIQQEGMQWETLLYKSPRTRFFEVIDKLQALQTPLKGLDIALASSPSFPIKMADQELVELLVSLKENVNHSLTIASSASETKNRTLDKLLHKISHNFPTLSDLPAFTFLFCFNFIQTKLLTEELFIKIGNKSTNSSTEQYGIISRYFGKWRMSKERLKVALKCALALSSAVFFGIRYSKDNGFWSGLTVAVGMVFVREATSTVANLKAQGTVLGSIYGVLICFIVQNSIIIRFVFVIPFAVFATFLRTSRMYGPVGAASTLIGALIILGRKDYGSPSEFAIVRIAEAFIGLGCSIMAELLLTPNRAATLSKTRLSQSLNTLNECVQSMSFHVCEDDKMNFYENKLKAHVAMLQKLIAEAEIEPNFWFVPFHRNCYGRLLETLSKMQDLLGIATRATEFVTRESHKLGVAWKEHHDSIEGDLDVFRKIFGLSLNCLSEVTSIESLATIDDEMKRWTAKCDIEQGTTPKANGCMGSSVHEDEMEKITNSYLQHSGEMVRKIRAFEVEENLKSRMILSLSALGFCMHSFLMETRELEKNVKDLIQWENPSVNVDLYAIQWKKNALSTKFTK